MNTLNQISDTQIKEIIENIKENMRNMNHEDAYEQQFIMLKNFKLVPINEYTKMVMDKKIDPNNAIAYITYDFIKDKFSEYIAHYLYPLLWSIGEVFYAYISKMGAFYSVEDYDMDGNPYIRYYSVPALSLKYAISYFEVTDKTDTYSTIEIVDLDTAPFRLDVNFLLSYFDNINDSDVIRSLFFDIMTMKLFSHYNACDASDKLKQYLKGNVSLEKEVIDIINDYNKIFKPIKVCMKNYSYTNCSPAHL